MTAPLPLDFGIKEETQTVRTARDLATKILAQVMQSRRLPAKAVSCRSAECRACSEQHLGRLLGFVLRNEPVRFVLPAFPGKSPNPAKVLGARPDMAERQSLAFLNSLGEAIQRIYAPGAKIVLCSDGRVFNDVVGITESDITTYQLDVDWIIAELGATNLVTFNLDDVFESVSFGRMRNHLMTNFGEPLENVQAEVRAGGDALSLYRGITRFLYEDGLHPEMTMSKAALQKDCRRRAYEVIRRSRAWDRLLAGHFPDAVRLSIHPQGCGSRKIGVHLMETKDEWLTAWHSVAVEVDGRFRLMKRQHAEGLGGRLVFRDGRPSHYVMGAPKEVQ